MSAEEDRTVLVTAAKAMLRPCLWHGTTGGPSGPQPAGGVGHCAQCERRHDMLVVDPRVLLSALGEEVPE